jgi:hypothetical protein
MLATDILMRLEANPPLAHVLELTHVQRFLELTVRMWPDIVDENGAPPVVLPSQPAAFLSAVLELPPDIITLSWLAFADAAAALEKEPPVGSVDDAFRLHGRDHGMGESFRVLFSRRGAGAETTQVRSISARR